MGSGITSEKFATQPVMPHSPRNAGARRTFPENSLDFQPPLSGPQTRRWMFVSQKDRSLRDACHPSSEKTACRKVTDASGRKHRVDGGLPWKRDRVLD